MEIIGTKFWIGEGSDEEEKGGVTRNKSRDKQSNTLIINLWLSRGFETCASGKGIEAENSMKR